MKRIGWAILLAGSILAMFAMVGCGDNSAFGVRVSGASDDERLQLERAIGFTVATAPDDDVGDVTAYLEGVELQLVDDAKALCNGGAELGCAWDGHIVVERRGCADLWPSVGILAHEIGHALGHDHDNVPWYGDGDGDLSDSVEGRVWWLVCYSDVMRGDAQ